MLFAIVVDIARYCYFCEVYSLSLDPEAPLTVSDFQGSKVCVWHSSLHLGIILILIKCFLFICFQNFFRQDVYIVSYEKKLFEKFNDFKTIQNSSVGTFQVALKACFRLNYTPSYVLL